MVTSAAFIEVQHAGFVGEVGGTKHLAAFSSCVSVISVLMTAHPARGMHFSSHAVGSAEAEAACQEEQRDGV